VTEQPVRAGGRVRAQPVADIDGQHDAAVVAAWYLPGGNNFTEPANVDPALVHTVIQSTMTTPMLDGQRQLDQRGDRPISAQHRIGQFEQRVGPRGQAVVELLPETRQLPELIYRTPILHTDHAALGVDLLPSQEA
jgi:hypothetical protein